MRLTRSRDAVRTCPRGHVFCQRTRCEDLQTGHPEILGVVFLIGSLHKNESGPTLQLRPQSNDHADQSSVVFPFFWFLPRPTIRQRSDQRVLDHSNFVFFVQYKARATSLLRHRRQGKKPSSLARLDLVAATPKMTETPGDATVAGELLRAAKLYASARHDAANADLAADALERADRTWAAWEREYNAIIKHADADEFEQAAIKTEELARQVQNGASAPMTVWEEIVRLRPFVGTLPLKRLGAVRKAASDQLARNEPLALLQDFVDAAMQREDAKQRQATENQRKDEASRRRQEDRQLWFEFHTYFGFDPRRNALEMTRIFRLLVARDRGVKPKAEDEQAEREAIRERLPAMLEFVKTHQEELARAPGTARHLAMLPDLERAVDSGDWQAAYEIVFNFFEKPFTTPDVE